MFDYSKSSGEIWLYDEITAPGYGGISAGDVAKAIKAIGKKAITIRINSPGGDVNEGVAIFNLLDNHSKKVTTINDSLAASIANYIFMAGADRLVANNSLSMLHLPWTIAVGDAEAMRKTADLLDKAAGTLIDTYSAKMGIDADEVTEVMTAETWYTGNEAFDAGMATAVQSDNFQAEPFKVAAARFKNTPSKIRVAKAAGSNYRPKAMKLKRLIAEKERELSLTAFRK